MPQLDSTIIFTQLFWLIFTFSFLYGCFLHIILPVIVKTLKLRNELIQLQSTTQSTTKESKKELLKSSMSNLCQTLQYCESQNINKIKQITYNTELSSDKEKPFAQKLHLLLVYNLTK